MGLSKSQILALDPCDAFLTELPDARTNLDNLFGQKEACELADFMAMPIRASDKLFVILREEILPLAKLQEIDSEILSLLSPQKAAVLANIRTPGSVHYYANAAHLYTEDFTRPVATPTSPVSISPLTGEETLDPDYVAPNDPAYLSPEAVEELIITTIRERAEALLAIVEGLI